MATKNKTAVNAAAPAPAKKVAKAAKAEKVGKTDKAKGGRPLAEFSPVVKAQLAEMRELVTDIENQLVETRKRGDAVELSKLVRRIGRAHRNIQKAATRPRAFIRADEAKAAAKVAK